MVFASSEHSPRLTTLRECPLFWGKVSLRCPGNRGHSCFKQSAVVYGNSEQNGGSYIAKARVTPLTIVEDFDVLPDRSFGLGTTRSFTSSAKVNIRGEDPGTDDDLGTITVRESQAGDGTQTGNFHRLDGADYHLTYCVL